VRPCGAFKTAAGVLVTVVVGYVVVAELWIAAWVHHWRRAEAAEAVALERVERVERWVRALKWGTPEQLERRGIEP
jgi:hypothetical protein